MQVFVDTSALYAVLDRDDANHAAAAQIWDDLLDRLETDDIDLITTGSHIVETAALVQHRLGIDPARALLDDLIPLFDVVWVDAELHARATTALLAAGHRQVSLVDWTGFQVMRERAIETAFAFDDDFANHGFTMLSSG